MDYAYLYLLGLLIVGLGAAYKFATLAKKKGYLGGKATRYPLLLMLAAIAASAVLFSLAILVGLSMPSWLGSVNAVYIVASWFIIAVNLLVLNLAYKNMKAAPDAGQPK